MDLTTRFFESSHLDFIRIGTREGNEVFRRGLVFLIFYLLRKLSPDASILVEHSLNRGLYCEFRKIPAGLRGAVAWLRGEVENAVRENHPFLKVTVPLQKAEEIFHQQHQQNTADLLRYIGTNEITLYRYRDVYGYFNGPLPPSTLYLRDFQLESYPPGFIIRYKSQSPRKPHFHIWNQRKLFRVYNEHEQWAKILGVADIASLNRVVESGEISDFIKLAEALQEKKIIHIAEQITSRVYDERGMQNQLVLIAGPSSSGKTTFSKRLAIQLRVNGMRPLMFNLDNYFIERVRTPKTPAGTYDFETPQALDLELFREHLRKLLKGKRVKIPSFDFRSGKRKPGRTCVQLMNKQPILIEGIHALNDDLTEGIDEQIKYKIYISALTTLNVDNHNRILTSDNRLIRRIIRDCKFRGYSAVETIRRWPQVRMGENQHIFTFQEEAEIVFNSALIYEFAVFKPLVTPLLGEVSTRSKAHGVTKQLLDLFSLIKEVSPDEIPPTSVLREFIGGSSFRY
jgi:uridine kinase